MGLSTAFKPYLPKSLLGRTLLIIVMPLVLLQVISMVIFFESHWSKVGRRLALGVAGDIDMVIELSRLYPGDVQWTWIATQAQQSFQINIRFQPAEVIEIKDEVPQGLLEGTLALALDERVRKPYRIDADSQPRFVLVDIQMVDGVLHVIVPRKRLFSTTTYVFILWMVGSSLLLFGVATIFMKNQVRPIRRLAEAADDFGKGRDAPKFKPEGALEVRQAASAFLDMRDRLQRQIQQRTDMLAGVSHDLRTPITRMKLQLAMMEGQDGAEDLKTDIGDLEHMLEEYLAFARGQGAEQPIEISLTKMLGEITDGARRKGGVIDLHCEGDIHLMVRANAMKRSLTNLVDNAVRYADNITIRAGLREAAVEIVIDDDGPGIPIDKRDEVFRPFIRLDTSRNPVTGGVGLGMTIARDVIRGHGGEISLDDAPGGGLRVRVSLPL